MALIKEVAVMSLEWRRIWPNPENIPKKKYGCSYPRQFEFFILCG